MPRAALGGLGLKHHNRRARKEKRARPAGQERRATRPTRRCRPVQACSRARLQSWCKSEPPVRHGAVREHDEEGGETNASRRLSWPTLALERVLKPAGACCAALRSRACQQRARAKSCVWASDICRSEGEDAIGCLDPVLVAAGPFPARSRARGRREELPGPPLHTCTPSFSPSSREATVRGRRSSARPRSRCLVPASFPHKRPQDTLAELPRQVLRDSIRGRVPCGRGCSPFDESGAVSNTGSTQAA